MDNDQAQHGNVDSSTSFRYITEITNVEEVTLVGSADLAFWHHRLAGQGLFLSNADGRATLWLGATNLQWMSIRYSELTIALAVCEYQADCKQDSFYLVDAFSSSRVLAGMERAFFQTPYHYAHIQVSARIPCGFSLGDRHRTLLKARMSNTARQAWSGDQTWEGAIFLPHTKKANGPGRQFFARLGGHTQSFPFAPGLDSLEFNPSMQHLAMYWLMESNFTAREWRIRANATHARSRTFTNRPKASRPGIVPHVSE